MNCPLCGALLQFLRIKSQTVYYRCPRHGVLICRQMGACDRYLRDPVGAGSTEGVGTATTVTRSKELRRIQNAIEHRDGPELRWALQQCEIRKKLALLQPPTKRKSAHRYRLERAIRTALAEIEQRS